MKFMRMLLMLLCTSMMFCVVIKAEDVKDSVCSDTICNENFEDSSQYEKNISVKNAGTFKIKDYSEYAIGKALTTFASIGINGSTIYSFNEIPYTAEVVNKYIEVEFDVFTDLNKSRWGQISFLNKEKTLSVLDVMFNMDGTISFMGKKAIGMPNETISVGAFEIGKWYRIKLVIKIPPNTVEQSEVCTIEKFYINGENRLEMPMFFAGKDRTNLGAMELLVRYKEKEDDREYSLAIDNLNVKTFLGEENIEEGLSNLLILIRRAKKFIKSCNLSEIELSQFKDTLEDCETVFEKYPDDKEKIKNAVSALNSRIRRHIISYESVVVTDNDEKVYNTLLEKGTLNEITFRKHIDGKLSLMIFLAFYNNNTLSDIYFDKIIVDENTEYFSAKIDKKLPNDIKEKEMKIMVFDSETMVPYIEVVLDTSFGSHFDWDIFVDGTKYNFDTGVVFSRNGILYVPAKNILNVMTMDMRKQGEGYIATRDDGKSIVLYEDADIAIINGETQQFDVSTYMYENKILMVPLEMIDAAFGVYIECDSINKKLTILTEDYIKPIYDVWNPENASFETGVDWATFSLIYGNKDAKIEVLRKVSYKTSYDFNVNCWQTTYPLHYADGLFYGSFSNLIGNNYYDLLIKITENGVEKIYSYPAAFQTKMNIEKDPDNEIKNAIEENVYQTYGELYLVSTFENIGYYLDVEQKFDEINVFYKKSSDIDWKEAYQPFFDTEVNQYRGSIVWLESNTAYDVKVKLKNSDSEITKTASITTWNDEPIISKTIEISDLYDSHGVILQGLHGTEDGWIKITDTKDTILNAAYNDQNAICISDCSFVILENLTIRGGRKNGVNITGNSKNIRIINCDISEWGCEKVLSETQGVYWLDGTSIKYESGIKMLDASNVVVERCYIHDPVGTTNTWNGKTWSNVHPNGPYAITYNTKNATVIRYNDLIGSREHSFEDAIAGLYNGYRSGGASRDTDIYGNMVIYGEDDGIELDGGQMNARVYNNRIEGFLCGISVAPNMTGPTYLYRNLIINLGESRGEVGRAVKTGNSPDNINGITYLFNNTFDSYASAVDNCNFNGPEYHSVSRNNIFVTRTAGGNALTNTTADENDNNDYDLMFGKVLVKDGDELNGIAGLPTYTSIKDGDYTLSEGSLGIDSGIYLNNFSDGYTEGNAPDMGAYEYSADCKNSHLRPIDVYSDKYLIEISGDEIAQFTIHIGEIPSGLTYVLQKNTDSDWLSVLSDGGANNNEVKANTTMTFKICADLEKCSKDVGYGVLLFRLSNGYSIPITIISK